MSRVAPSLLVALLVGCTSSGSFAELERESQARFARCWANVGGGFCGPLSLAHADCRNGYQARYAASEDGARYLTELGCAAEPALVEAAPACPEAAPCPACPSCPACPACASGGEAPVDSTEDVAPPSEEAPTEANDAIDAT